MTDHASDGRKPKGCVSRILPGCGLLILVGAVVMIGLVAWIFGIPSGYQSGYHPFRSQLAKSRYLKAYDELAKAWPVDVQDVTLNSRFGVTHVRISGPEDSPPLLLLHGVGGNALQWTVCVEELAAHYRVLVPDIITENGKSVYEVEFRSADDYVAWLDDTLEQLDVSEPVNIAGMSYGGWITARYALARPDNVSRIALIAPAGTVSPLSMAWIKRAIKCALPSPRYTSEFMRWLLADTWKSGEAGRKTVDQWADFSYLAVRSFKPKRTVHPDVLSAQEWNAIRVPVLYMVGENEKIYDPDQAVARLHREAPRIKTIMIAGAGHDLVLIKTDEVIRHLMEFFQDEQPDRSSVTNVDPSTNEEDI